MRTPLLLILTLIITIFYSCEGNRTKEANHNESDKELLTETKDASSDTSQNPDASVLNETELQNLESLSETWDLKTTIGEGMIWRKEKVDGSDNWTEIVVTNIFGFKHDMDTGEIVQIVPLRKELPIITLAVVKTTKRDDFEADIWYEVKLESIPEKYTEYRTIKSPPELRQEYPSEVIVVYPAVRNCSLLYDIQFEAKDLPENISNDIIKGALDFDGDNLPDAIICSFCCKTRKPTGNCDYICSETYIKLDNKWTMVDSSQPM
ncbi:MAG: hypothetical protein C0598_03460 [Marinilabiliales bacterium]|nr:MAG: hypothetical protein C0598_03460 [Marinilabiliales bacterium]